MTEQRQSGFSSLREWIQTHQITIINAALTVVLIGLITTVLLNNASSSLSKTAEESMLNLTGMTAKDIQSKYQSYIDVARTISGTKIPC
jgi:hypothetical protein